MGGPGPGSALKREGVGGLQKIVSTDGSYRSVSPPADVVAPMMQHATYGNIWQTIQDSCQDGPGWGKIRAKAADVALTLQQRRNIMTHWLTHQDHRTLSYAWDNAPQERNNKPRIMYGRPIGKDKCTVKR